MHEPPDHGTYPGSTLYPWRLVITALFNLCILGGPLLAVKDAEVFGILLPGSIILFPFSFGIAVVVAEVYGYPTAERMVYVGLACLLILAIAFEILLHLPPAPGWRGQRAFEVLYGVEPRFLIGGIVAFCIGQTFTVWAYREVGRVMHGRRLWLRLFGVPLTAQLVTVGIGIPLSLVGVLPLVVVAHLAYNRVLAAIAQSVIAAPILWAGIVLLRYLEVATVAEVAKELKREADAALGGQHGRTANDPGRVDGGPTA